jgi:glutathione S-transferase
MTDRPYELHGLKLSYFTGKLEAYLRAKGIAFTFVEMDTADFRRCAKETGVAQMPQLRTPQGDWLTDTTAIMARFEDQGIEPQFRPLTATGAFLSRLLEDAFDEWLWRPALYFRWAFEEDSRLMGRQIARTMLRDVPAPLWMRSLAITTRQKREYLRADGVTRDNGPAIERHYLAVLDILEPVLAAQPFLFGDRPCEADFGLFGPMFRHFHCDPTPGRIMRARAPSVAAWVTRLWALNGIEGAYARSVTSIPDDLGGVFSLIRERFLPELATNAAALAAGKGQVRYRLGDHDFRYPTNPYRAGRLSRLQREYSALPPSARDAVTDLIGTEAARLLAGPFIPEPDLPPGLRDRRGLPTH